jgi:hypothetical protein
MNDKRELQGKLMDNHRRILNEISDIKSKNYELSQEDKLKIQELEKQLKLVAGSLYNLYKQ